MTEKELKRLSRTELLELLIEETRRGDRLEQELREAKEKLESREIKKERAGTLAEAALSINSVLEAADAAARQYLENVRNLAFDPAEESARMLAETEQRCRDMMEQAERDAQRYRDQVKQKLQKLINSDPQLRQALVNTAHKETNRKP